MFGGSTERCVARRAEKIVSLKEDLDARSWSRVLEIGRILERSDDAAVAQHGDELASIAQSNLSLRSRLGIGFQGPSAQVMASGMEVFEGGLAAAALDDDGDRAVDAGGDAEAAEVAEPILPVDDEAFEASGAGESDTARPSVPESADEGPAVEVPRRSESAPSPNELAPDRASDAVDDADGRQEPSEGGFERSSTGQDRPSPSQLPARRERFARFRHLYESRDGGLCVFEDAEGHIVAVDASKLA